MHHRLLLSQNTSPAGPFGDIPHAGTLSCPARRCIDRSTAATAGCQPSPGRPPPCDPSRARSPRVQRRLCQTAPRAQPPTARWVSNRRRRSSLPRSRGPVPSAPGQRIPAQMVPDASVPTSSTQARLQHQPDRSARTAPITVFAAVLAAMSPATRSRRFGCQAAEIRANFSTRRPASRCRRRYRLAVGAVAGDGSYASGQAQPVSGAGRPAT